jgi:hypothetical protein
MPAIAVVALHQEADRVERLAHTVLRTWGGVMGLIVVLVVLGWAQFGAAWSYEPAITQLTVPNRQCPPHTRGLMDIDPNLYYSCVSYLMWRTDELPLVETATGGDAAAFWSRMALAAVVALLVLDARDRPRPLPRIGTMRH